MQYEEIRGKSVFHMYSSVADIVAADVPEISVKRYDANVTNNQSGQNWWGTGLHDYSDVINALQRGWPEGTKIMRENITPMKPAPVPSVRRKRKRRDHGDSFDIHRVYRGDISTAWDKREREIAQSATKSHITVAVDIGCSAAVSAENAMWRGAAAVSICEAALASGRQVRVVAVDGTKQPFCDSEKAESAYLAVVLKGYDQRISTDVLMSLASMPGMFRTQFFKALTRIDPDAEIKGNFGFPTPFERSFLSDSSLMVWVGMNTLDKRAAQTVVDNAVTAMTERVNHLNEQYRKTA